MLPRDFLTVWNSCELLYCKWRTLWRSVDEVKTALYCMVTDTPWLHYILCLQIFTFVKWTLENATNIHMLSKWLPKLCSNCLFVRLFVYSFVYVCLSYSPAASEMFGMCLSGLHCILITVMQTKHFKKKKKKEAKLSILVINKTILTAHHLSIPTLDPTVLQYNRKLVQGMGRWYQTLTWTGALIRATIHLPEVLHR